MPVKSKIIFLILFFVFSFHTFSTFAQSQSNLDKLALPFLVNFSDKEIKYLNSLSQTDLEKLVKVIKLIVEKNKSSTSNSKINQFFSGQNSVSTTGSSQTSQQPTTYSNTPSPQTPHFNPSTGQYQSNPPSQAEQTQQTNPYSNFLPFSGTPTGQPQNAVPPTPLTTMLQQANQQLKQPNSGNIDTSVADNTPNGTCPNSTGVQWSGQSSCPRDIGPNPNMRKAILEACQKIQKPLKAQSIYRPLSCNGKAGGAPNSNHISGRAMDLHLDNLNSKERVIVFQVFKKNGFSGYGCYGNRNYIHLSISNTERYGQGCPPELFISGYATQK